MRPVLGHDPMRPVPVRVLRRRREIPGTWTLELDGDCREARGFAAGQFNMLYVFGVGEIPISLSGDPAKPHRQVHTVRAVGPVSRALTGLRTADTVGLRGPFGKGWPVEAAAGADVLLLAGGLGLAPLRPALYQILSTRKRYGRVALLYGTRSPQDILFRRELERWRQRPDLQVRVTVDHADSAWPGRVGVVTHLVALASFDPAETVAFVCGPEVMMRFSIAALQEAGVNEAAIHLSMERNMKCAFGHCGHCQFGPTFICKDGPVLSFERVRGLLSRKEI